MKSQKCIVLKMSQLDCDLQVIDVKKGSLQNVIEFPPDGAFIVESDISVSSDQRIDFNFTGAALKLPQQKVHMPPRGKGWCAAFCS